MAENFTVKMFDTVAIDATPNMTIGGIPDDELLAMLDADEVLEPSVASSAEDVGITVMPTAALDDDIAGLLGDLDLNITSGVTTTTPAAIATAAAVTDEILAAAVASAESTELAVATAAAAAADVSPGAVPTTAADGSDAFMPGGMSAMEVLAELESLGADTEPVAATEKVEKKAKTPAVPRKHYTNKVERLKDRVGEGLSAVSLLTAADASLDPTDALERTMHIIAGMNKKEQNRATNLVEFITGKASSLSNVLDRVIRLLHKEGFITTGEKGSVMANLLAKPYSPTSARAMGANTVAVFADLMLIKADGKGRYVANPESVLLAVVNQKLGLV